MIWLSSLIAEIALPSARNDIESKFRMTSEGW